MELVAGGHATVREEGEAEAEDLQERLEHEEEEDREVVEESLPSYLFFSHRRQSDLLHDRVALYGKVDGGSPNHHRVAHETERRRDEFRVPSCRF